MIILSFLFLLTATLYSSVGFGGGSTYLALLLIWDIPYLIFPVIALFCNIIVVSGNCINYIKAGNFNLKILTPYLISSIPLAFIGGSLSVDKEVFEILLFAVLTLAGVILLVKFQSFDQKIEVYKKIPKMLSLLIGASIGFVSGVVGIGGGIFLSPILLLIKADKVKKVIEDNFNLSPRGIREMLKLNKPIYEITSAYGHFGRIPDDIGSFSWEKIDKTSHFSK